MKQELEQAIATVVKDVFGFDVNVDLTRPDEQFGDYATNVALQLAKQVGKNPRKIAEQIREKLVTNERLAGVEIAGPGFLNLTLSDQALVSMLSAAPNQPLAGKHIVTEYSDPNPFKVLHAGHLYTSIVGDAISRLLEHAGAKVERLNFGGDVGLHVGKTMWAILHEVPSHVLSDAEAWEHVQEMSNDSLSARAQWMAGRYMAGTAAYDEDETAKQEIIELNKRVYKLYDDSDTTSDFARLYLTCREWSYEYFKAFYADIDVAPFHFIPESETAPIGLATVREQLANGVYEESDGAVVFNGEKYGLHTRVFINSHGLPTYEAKDVGLSIKKWNDYHFDESVIITGNDIIEYMKVVLKSIEQFAPELAQRTVHLTHGQVKLQGGVKMSSRKGNVLYAQDVLDAAADAAKELSELNNRGTALAAVKYAFLKNRMGGDTIYDPAESVSLQGNSGPYLQYAHARARSILSKVTNAVISSGAEKSSQKGGEDLSTTLRFGRDDIKLSADERSLVRKISEYQEAVGKATAELMPHHVCTYLYELAQKFNQFYEHNRVIGDEREAVRLELVKHYADTLKNGLELLGITAPEQM